jgi:hypothetical protein
MKIRYPARLHLEVYVNPEWIESASIYVENRDMLFKRIIYLKTMYNIKGKKYRMYLTVQSKMNKGVVETTPET